MRKALISVALLVAVVLITFSLTGCTIIFQRGRPQHVEKISQLQRELDDLERARAELQDKIGREKGVKVEMMDRGLVITFLNEVLFDSGKAKLKTEALSTLEKVAGVLKTTVRDLNVGIEGHTDNVPIKYSGWKSNWELSAARALSVLHYLVDDQDVAPQRLTQAGYGEFRPVASNDTKEGRQQNRRVEIVILPNKVVQKGSAAQEENLK